MVSNTISTAEEVHTTSVFETLFERHVPYEEDKDILIDGARTTKPLKFKDIKHMVLCIAEGLKSNLGLQRGDTVAIFSPNHILYPVVTHGIVAAGGISAAIDHTELVQTLISDIDQVNAKFLITHEDNIDKALEAARSAKKKIDPSRILTFGDQALKGIRTVKQVLIDHCVHGIPVKYQPADLEKTVAYLYFTSGSTGRKKAVIVTHAMILASLLMNNTAFLSPKEVGLSYTGFHHVTALWMTMHVSIYYGVQTVILRQFKLEEYCKKVEQYKVTISFVQPWVIASLARESIVDDYNMSSLQNLLFGGAALDRSVLESLHARFPIRVYNGYGLTEAHGIFITTPEITAKGSVGVPARNMKVKLVDDDGKDATDKKRGELCIKGPTLTIGYYNEPEMTANAIDSEGFFHTGDMFYINDDGQYTFAGRKKDLIKYHLYHIHPLDIESILDSHPKVTDCGVIGIYSDEQTTELPTAYVTLIKGVKADENLARELQLLLDDKEKDHMRLRGGVYIVKELPRTSTGKLQRQKLCDIGPENILASA